MFLKFGTYWLLTLGLFIIGSQPSLALPPPDDIPEEVLRTEIILEARSPEDGRPLTAVEYAKIREELATSPYPPQVSPKIRHLIFLLQIRKAIRTFFPFF
ncbi:MAG: hypothetical protein VKJ02_06585 [Snowella sp.]|nr:hypothetical protein [Snowella sp.]